MDPQLTPLDPGAVWTMVCAGLVLLMTPGLAFFYGGMTRAKASVNMMMMSFVAMGLVGVVWVLWACQHGCGWVTRVTRCPGGRTRSRRRWTGCR